MLAQFVLIFTVQAQIRENLQKSMENQRNHIEKMLDCLDQPKTIYEIGYQIYLK